MILSGGMLGLKHKNMDRLENCGLFEVPCCRCHIHNDLIDHPKQSFAIGCWWPEDSLFFCRH